MIIFTRMVVITKIIMKMYPFVCLFLMYDKDDDYDEDDKTKAMAKVMMKSNFMKI